MKIKFFIYEDEHRLEEAINDFLGFVNPIDVKDFDVVEINGLQYFKATVLFTEK